jgi:hypothetical protein
MVLRLLGERGSFLLTVTESGMYEKKKGPAKKLKLWGLLLAVPHGPANAPFS